MTTTSTHPSPTELLLARLRRPRHLPYDTEAPVARELTRLGYVDLRTIADDTMTKTTRSRIRYLAALFPDLDRRQLADTIHAVIGNPRLSQGDMRVIIDGRSLSDPSRSTHEVPIEGIQSVGRTLMAGGSLAAAARASGLALGTVESIDGWLGLSQAREDRVFDAAVDAVRDGESVRKFAAAWGLSKDTAHRTMKKAREVLVEIGEMK